jgi:uncharacterized protein YbjT (DUF2867 family)
VREIQVVVRRKLGIEHPKLAVHIVDFKALPSLLEADEAYLALGTTIKVAGSQAAFRAVDLDANLAVAEAAYAAGVRRLGLVSAMGANPRSRVFYNRVKGELEQELARIKWNALVIARPSLLLGDRKSLNQPARAGEGLFTSVSLALGPLMPRNFRPIAAAKVAKALLDRVPAAKGHEVLLSGQMQ